MGALQPWHWIVVIAIVLLLFGSTRLPGLAKSVGQSMKIFKKEIRDLRDDKSEGTDGNAGGNAGDNAPGASTHSTTGSTTHPTTGSTAGPAASSDTGAVPGLIDHKDRDLPKA